MPAVPVRLPSTIDSHACSGSVKLYAVVTPLDRKSSDPCSVDQYSCSGVMCAVVPSIASHQP